MRLRLDTVLDLTATLAGAAVIAVLLLPDVRTAHRPHASHVPLSFCADVIDAFQKAGRPWGNQMDWVEATYPRQSLRAAACLDELADDPPPGWLDPDVSTLIPFHSRTEK